MAKKKKRKSQTIVIGRVGISNIEIKKMEASTPWSIREENLLRKLFPDNSIREIANQIGRSVPAVSNKAHKLGFRKPRPYPDWSKKELNLLKKLYPSRTAQEVADKTGRSVQAVRKRIVKLGLKKKKQKTRS